MEGIELNHQGVGDKDLMSIKIKQTLVVTENYLKKLVSTWV